MYRLSLLIALLLAHIQLILIRRVLTDTRIFYIKQNRSVFLSFFFLSFSVSLVAQTPHGEKLTMDCADCHNYSGWETLKSDMEFNHNDTEYILENSHQFIDCKSCHTTLVFDETPSQCFECHTDVHSMSVGNDCMSCHTTSNWLVDNIPELHEQNGFALVGPHANPSCVDCHLSENNLRFDRIGNDCTSCHLDEYANTQTPNHQSAGFSTDCIECHNPFALSWTSETIRHNFFPLEGGHDIQDCFQCHQQDDYSTLSADCASCHLEDHQASTNPSHTNLNFSTDCTECHDINAWSPSTYDHSAFPLLGAHAELLSDCNACHQGSYENTPNTCVACHQDNFNETTNPNHVNSQFSTDCLECHNEEAWVPSTFDHSTYPLLGAHADLISDCNICHQGNYENTPNTCVACHQDDYNDTNNPNHQTAQFPTDCLECHNEDTWTPSTFDHDALYFPIYSGEHNGEWNQCTECHINSSNYAIFSCIDCHEHNNRADMDDEHDEVSGYVYESNACYDCHPTGDDD